MPVVNFFSRKDLGLPPMPNQWDMGALLLFLLLAFILAWAGKQMVQPFEVGSPIAIGLAPGNLLYYSVLSVLRMLVGISLSLLFTLTVGTVAAKSYYGERIIIPLIDLLQSVPVLGFLALSLPAFMALFPGSRMGPECAAIFLIFTSQVWNMTLSFYQSVKTVPHSLQEAARSFQLSAWQRFWRLEVPFAMPGLLWNTMLSLSAGWFFVVASEAISIANQTILLPGIGSYIATAIKAADGVGIGYAILAMCVVIITYDQLMFRPLCVWAEKFQMEPDTQGLPQSWVQRWFSRARLMRYLMGKTRGFLSTIINARMFQSTPRAQSLQAVHSQIGLWLGWAFALIMVALCYQGAQKWFVATITGFDIVQVLYLGMWTLVRVFALVLLCALVWLPVGVWIGLRPLWARRLQPVIQMLAAFPANLLFPVVVIYILKYQLNMNIWCSPLMVLGTQWYILFNVIAGTQAVPKSLHYAISLYQVRDLLWWRRFMLPAVLPSLMTGLITAAGGAWNASIVAEWVMWGDHVLKADGLGAYITQMQHQGLFIHMALGVVTMCSLVLLVNRIVWLPLFHWVQKRFSLQ